MDTEAVEAATDARNFALLHRLFIDSSERVRGQTLQHPFDRSAHISAAAITAAARVPPAWLSAAAPPLLHPKKEKANGDGGTVSGPPPPLNPHHPGAREAAAALPPIARARSAGEATYPSPFLWSTGVPSSAAATPPPPPPPPPTPTPSSRWEGSSSGVTVKVFRHWAYALPTADDLAFLAALEGRVPRGADVGLGQPPRPVAGPTALPPAPRLAEAWRRPQMPPPLPPPHSAQPSAAAAASAAWPAFPPGPHALAPARPAPLRWTPPPWPGLSLQRVSQPLPPPPLVVRATFKPLVSATALGRLSSGTSSSSRPASASASAGGAAGAGPLLLSGARGVLGSPNAGGSSENSEALSVEILERCYGARLWAAETQVRYDAPGCSIIDYIAAVRRPPQGSGVRDLPPPLPSAATTAAHAGSACARTSDVLIGVSVTRAMKYVRPPPLPPPPPPRPSAWVGGRPCAATAGECATTSSRARAAAAAASAAGTSDASSAAAAAAAATFSASDAEALLGKKLAGLRAAAEAVSGDHAWDVSLLHVWAETAAAADAVCAAAESPGLRALASGVVILVTLSPRDTLHHIIFRNARASSDVGGERAAAAAVVAAACWPDATAGGVTGGPVSAALGLSAGGNVAGFGLPPPVPYDAGRHNRERARVAAERRVFGGAAQWSSTHG